MNKDTISKVKDWLDDVMTDEEFKVAIIEWLKAAREKDLAYAEWRRSTIKTPEAETLEVEG